MVESEAMGSSVPMSLAYISSPFNDIMNLPPSSETATTSPLRRPSFARSLSIVSDLVIPPPAAIHQTDSHRSIRFPWSTAGPSCSPSDHLLDEHECMTSDFGSELSGSDAVVYGDSNKEEESFPYNCHAEDEQFDDGMFCSEDTVVDDDGSTSDTSSSQYSTATGSLDGEGPVPDGASQDGEDASSEDVGSYDELADPEGVPQDVPAPAASEDVSSSLRRSAHDRRPTMPYAGPPAALDKSKGKATASKALPRSRSATPKRACSPEDEPKEDDAPGRLTVFSLPNFHTTLGLHIPAQLASRLVCSLYFSYAGLHSLLTQS
ncbi:hypothetical protein LXA43DRAFT_667266 [Ganoderma leucocontextum]|nr:hypothetical protein LXA43DRAFT_667266 [Ganoderma leucocontextum]